jgi:hypothetical protein
VIKDTSGYLHPAYAASFDDIAKPCELPACGAWILERAIAGSDLRDGTGCYPLFCCRDWTRLGDDVAELAGTLVTVTLVTDPFGDFRVRDLQHVFDVVRPFKQHYVTDLARSAELPATRRHRRNTARAARSVAVDVISAPVALADTWTELYAQLVARHGLSGLHAFSRYCLERQLSVPGLRMFSATAEGCVVGLHLWYVQGDVAYGHLGATSALGHELMASYALYAFAIEQLRSEVRWLALGSSPGDSDNDAMDGLTRFKQGWATGTRQVYLCGKVLQPDPYRQLGGDTRAGASYFPAYRRAELAARPASGPRLTGTER